MTVGRWLLVLVGALSVGCGRESWPSPPQVAQAKYEADHRAWRESQRGVLSDVLALVGIWPLQEGETAFGSDAALPIALPLSGTPDRLGMFRREGAMVTVVPGPASPLRLADGRQVREAMSVNDDLWIESFLLNVTDAGDNRRWVTARDMTHPAIGNPPAIDVYPLDARWRSRLVSTPSTRHGPCRCPMSAAGP